MRIENGSLAAALCVTVAAFVGGVGACSSDGGRTASPGAGGMLGGAGAPVAAGGSSGASAGAPSGGAPAGGVGGGAAGAPSAGASGENGHPKQRTVGYLPSYRGSLANWATQLDFSLVSYVDVCFATIAADGTVGYPDAGLSAFASAAHAKGVKVCLALGGATTIDNLGTLATNIAPAGRDAFVSKITSYAMTTGLDCIDVDFEGNGVNGDYEGFVTALGTSLHAQNKEMSAAMASWFGDNITVNALHAFDFVNVMAYDLHNPGGSATPLQSSSLADSKAEIDYFVGRGLAKEKAVFGVPFYGYRWKPGATAGEAVIYSELLQTYGADAANDQISKDGVSIYLNSKATIQAKAALARQYGGVMSWELGQDAAGDASLLRALNTAP